MTGRLAAALGTARVARAAPDGHTVGLTTVGPLTTQPHLPTLAYGADSFEYVCRTHVTPQVIAVPANSPFRTLKEFVEHARRNPGKVTMASTGSGSLPHLASVEFGQLAGFEWVHVPTKGDAEALQLAQACQKASTTPAFQAALETLRIPQGHQSPAAFAGFVRAESDRHGRLIRQVGAAAKAN